MAGSRRQSRLELGPVLDDIHDMLAPRVMLLTPGHRRVRQADVAILAVVARHREVAPRRGAARVERGILLCTRY